MLNTKSKGRCPVSQRCLRNDSEGLIHIMEFITAFIIFIVVMAVFFTSVAMEYSKMDPRNEAVYLRDKANIIMDVMVNTPGQMSLPGLPYYEDFSDLAGWDDPDSVLSTRNSMGVMTTTGTRRYIMRNGTHNGTVIWQFDFSMRDPTDAISLGLSGLDHLDRYMYVHVSNVGNRFVLRHRIEDNVTDIHTYDTLTVGAGSWYSMRITMDARGIVEFHLSYKNRAGEAMEIYTIPRNWNATFSASNQNGVLMFDAYMEYAPWEKYSGESIRENMISLGLGNGPWVRGELSMSKIYTASTHLGDEDGYDTVKNIFGLEPYENFRVSIISSDGNTVYMDWGANMEGADDLGSATRYVKIMSPEGLVGMALITVHVFVGGSY